MNLLLLLSALLSALTGAGVAVRPVGAVQAVAGQTRTEVAAVRAAAATRRPVATLPVLRAVATPQARSIRVPAAARLWQDRRRE